MKPRLQTLVLVGASALLSAKAFSQAARRSEVRPYSTPTTSCPKNSQTTILGDFAGIHAHWDLTYGFDFGTLFHAALLRE